MKDTYDQCVDEDHSGKLALAPAQETASEDVLYVFDLSKDIQGCLGAYVVTKSVTIFSTSGTVIYGLDRRDFLERRPRTACQY